MACCGASARSGIAGMAGTQRVTFKYLVTKSDGSSKQFDDKPAARVWANNEPGSVIRKIAQVR